MLIATKPRTLIIFLASLILVGCGAIGDGTKDRLNTNVKDRDYANLLLVSQSHTHTNIFKNLK